MQTHATALVSPSSGRSAKIIDGKAVAAKLRESLAGRVRQLSQASGIVPGLAVILVGENPASALYVKNKVLACAAVGVNSQQYRLPGTTTTEHLVELIATLNTTKSVHGILVQLPLPAHINMRLVLESIAVHKDVDAFHLYNVGALIAGNTIFPPCTPYGVLKLLEHEQIPIEGQNIVVVGASNIVGKPMALMLTQRDATVCICHAKTRDLAQFTILADILVVAAGCPNLILPQMVKTGAVVIDVGINRLPDGRVTGDVDFEGVRAKASYITPVPGGVGPMTVTMLLENTVAAAERSVKRDPTE
jgi:methylenetetrahydrofolate dehydrogenase (NADP+) / methenyltetrahydrofolate cyclohydrolase